jgi:hypothetical protein
MRLRLFAMRTPIRKEENDFGVGIRGLSFGGIAVNLREEFRAAIEIYHVSDYTENDGHSRTYKEISFLRFRQFEHSTIVYSEHLYFYSLTNEHA